MANIALKTAGKIEVVESLEQLTAPAAEAIVAGAPVRFDTTTGKLTNSNASTSAEARTYGIATRSVSAGMSLTAVARGVLDGYTLTTDFGTDVYLSDTDGRLADAAGTVSKILGQVIGGYANTLGSTPAKLLRVKF